MISIAQKHSPMEIGSSLLGAYSKDGYHASVLGCAPITTDSKGSRFTFSRGVEGLASFFLDLFKRTQGRRHYVGEWHSHPNGSAHPSQTDDTNQMAIANDKRTNCPVCILVIVGDNLTFCDTLSVYVYSKENGRIDLVSR